MLPTVESVIKPMCLRFGAHQGTLVYYAIGDPATQLDGVENMLGIDPQKQSLCDSNLGFLPVSHTVLIRGEKNILVDPNNHHVGFYGTLAARLTEMGTPVDQIDLVVNTHCHHDHSASNFVVRDRPLIIGPGELEFAREIYWPEHVEANFTAIMTEGQVVPDSGDMMEIMAGVWAIYTPGHTPGSISILVESDQGRVAIVGDVTMIRDEYEQRTFSHWYTDEQVRELNESLDRIMAWEPNWVVPGHDQMFQIK